MVRKKSATEMIVLGRIGILNELIAKFKLTVTTTFVPSVKNKDGVSTRIRKKWLTMLEVPTKTAECCIKNNEVQELHDKYHFGIDRTLFLDRQVHRNITIDAVKTVVETCWKC